MGHTHHHHHVPAGDGDSRYREVRRVTLVGALIDLLLGIAKVVVGVAAQSQALVADGVHSFSDLLTDGIVLFAAKHASRGADSEHPYGHARIETVATVLLGAALVLVAIGLAWDAVSRMFHPEALLHPGPAALVVAGVSVAAKEAIYWYTLAAARRLRSNLLRANAWHSRSDAISSVIVVAGVAGAMAGLDYLDAVAAVLVAAMIAHIGWGLGWNSLRELVDTGLEPARVAQIQAAISAIEGVMALHMLRSRRMGSDALVDVHIQVAPSLSVSEGHQIGETVRARLINQFDEITDVTVHIDPEDDEQASPCVGLPGREVMVNALRANWEGLPGGGDVEQITLHYLDGLVNVDLVLPLRGNDMASCTRHTRALVEAAHQIEHIGSVNVYYH